MYIGGDLAGRSPKREVEGRSRLSPIRCKHKHVGCYRVTDRLDVVDVNALNSAVAEYIH